MLKIAIIAILSGCSASADPVGPWVSGEEHGSSWGSESEFPTETSEAAGDGSETQSHSDLEGTTESTEDASAASSGDDGESEIDTGEESGHDSHAEADASEESEAGWKACGGDVPYQCLEIRAETEGCTGQVGGCVWTRCHTIAQLQFIVDLASCIERECDVEPVEDIECLQEWIELTDRCFARECDEQYPSACANVYNGGHAECHR